MTIRLHDSLSGAAQEFVPVVPGHASLYVCGPTVQSAPHIGHLRSALVYDLWRRWLEYRGYDVVLVRNVTDIDDKILHLATAQGEGADRAGEEWWALAYRVELDFSAAYRAIGVRPPTAEPRATANVDRMLALIERLIERGHAYRASDGSADIYFDTASWPSYGELTRQRPEDMADAADADPRGKRDPRDFALWKGAKPEEPSSAHWPSPWGPGRPGWHIECSAMAERYLGDRFDIHGGGLDLRFPHHENELAQSRAAGAPFASYWVHNGLVTVGGRKMSKSLGNSVLAADLLASARPLAVRYALAAAHYRSVLDHQDGFLDEAEAALSRIEGFLARAAGAADAIGTEVPSDFAAAMDDDLGVPQALAVLHGTVRSGNLALDAGDAAAVARLRGEVLAMTRVLGLDPADPAWGSAANDDGSSAALDVLVTRLLEARRAARADRDFAAADRIRDDLAVAGVVVEDSATGSRWSLTGRAGVDARPDGVRNGDG